MMAAGYKQEQTFEEAHVRQHGGHVATYATSRSHRPDQAGESKLDKFDTIEVGEIYDVIDMEMPDESTYTGQLSKLSKLKQGHGTQVWRDGSRY